MFTIEHLRKGSQGSWAPVPVANPGPFPTLHEARLAARKIYDGPPRLVVGVDAIRICKDGKEVEAVKAGAI